MNTELNPAPVLSAGNAPPPVRPPQKSKFGCYCCGCLVGAALLLMLFLIAAVYAIFYSSLPFKLMEPSLTQALAEEGVKLEGLSGSLSSGLALKSLKWGKPEAGMGEIADVRVTFNGWWDLVTQQRLIIREAHIGKLKLDLAELQNPLVELLSELPELSQKLASNTVPNAEGNYLKLFQIDRFHLANAAITNHLTGFSLLIPACEWTGFKATNGQLDLGWLTVESDRLKLVTKAGKTVAVAGQSITFQKRLEGSLLPGAQPASLRQAIPFALDVGYIQSKPACKLTVFDGKLVYYGGLDISNYFRCQDLDLAALWNAPLPAVLTLEAIKSLDPADKTERTKVTGGSFKLGVSTFQIQPVEFPPAGENAATHMITAVSRAGDVEFTYQFILGKRFWQSRQQLAAQPPLELRDTVARVFFGKLYADLAEPDQKQVVQFGPVFIKVETNAPAMPTNAIQVEASPEGR